MIRDFVLLGCVLGMKMLAGVEGVPTDWIQAGALGLCGYMIWANYKQQSQMGKLVNERHEEMVDIHERTITAMNEATDAIKKCKGPKDSD